MDADGNALWQADGVSVCLANSWQNDPQIIPDGSGGSIITWKDLRTAQTRDTYVQRLDSDGNAQWQADGVSLCVASGYEHEHQLVSDGSEGAIVTWEDNRNVATDWDIYAQRVESNGSIAWTLNGVGLCVYSNPQLNPQIASDGSGGAVVTWEDSRQGLPSYIYAQRVDSSGNIKWGAGCLKVSDADNQLHPQIASSGLGGAIIGWKDNRNHDSSGLDIYAQRMVDPDNDLSLPLVMRNYQ